MKAMKKFITLEQFNKENNLPKNKDILFKWKKEIAANLISKFSNSKFSDVTLANIIYSHYWGFYILSHQNGNKALFITYRNAGKYPDATIDVDAYYKLRNAVEQELVDEAYLITIWSDGKIWLSNISKGKFAFGNRDQNISTMLGKSTDGIKANQGVIDFAPELIYYIAVEQDETDHKPYISDKRINVDKLNKELCEVIPLF